MRWSVKINLLLHHPYFRSTVKRFAMLIGRETANSSSFGENA
jgi:hypothetical protein